MLLISRTSPREGFSAFVGGLLDEEIARPNQMSCDEDVLSLHPSVAPTRITTFFVG